MSRLNAVSAAAITFAALPIFSQSPAYGVGRAPAAAEIQAWDLAVGPDGKELPSGRGSAAIGRAVYARKCASCHGAKGDDGLHDVLAGGRGTLNSDKPLKTIGSYWPYATTVWDYTYRTMPFDKPGSMTPDEVYATTAYLLYLNGILGENDMLDARTLPQVKMPNRHGFIADPRPDTRKVAKTPKR